MRIRASLITLAAVGATAGLVATAASADGMPRAKHAAHACGCHAASHHVHRHAVRTHVRAQRHGWKRVVVSGGERMRGWHDEHGWSEEHQWREGGERVDYRWEERPWATDQFGFLTWPGKTHFIPHPADGGPPPGDGMAPPPPPPPGPPPGWRDGAHGDVQQDQDGYDVYRF